MKINVISGNEMVILARIRIIIDFTIEINDFWGIFRAD